MTNTFYIAANIIFDLATGETRNVLMLVNRPEDASIFSASDARSNADFVRSRSASKINWSIQPVTSTKGPSDLWRLRALGQQFIIKGEQDV